MKKRLLILLSILLVSLSLSACKSIEGKEADSSEFTIGILQLAEHPALDDARKGFEDKLKDLGMDVNIKYQNAHGDISNCITISQKFTREKVDLIYAIGTPAAQSAKQVTSDIPILFSAVTDPVNAGLVESWDKVGKNVTGTSDRADIKAQLELFKEIDSSIKDIGIIYNTGEANSKVQLNEADRISKSLGLNIVSLGVNNINDVTKALASLTGKVDAMYILSDNLIASSVELVSNTLIDKNMVSVSAEESQVGGGILITKGHSYYSLGGQTADIAKNILVDKVDIESLPVYLPEDINFTINESTLDKLDINKDLQIFIDAKKVNN